MTSPRRWRTPTPPPNPTSRTRRTGWKAIGPASTPPEQEELEHAEEATAVPTRDAEANRRGPVAGAGRLQPQSEDRPPARGQEAGDRHRRGHRLGDRRGAGFRQPAAGRQPRPPVGRGHPARHVQPAPRGADRSDQPERIRSAEQHRARSGEDRDLQFAAVGSRRARLRIRLLAGRSAHAGAVGGAVRRFRQRRAGDHRPVHRAAARPSGCACPAW